MRRQSKVIQEFIVDNIESHPKDIATLTSKKFSISRQAVNKHIRRLIEQQAISVKGTTRNRRYSLNPNIIESLLYDNHEKLEEDVVWRNNIFPVIKDLPKNVLDIWHYCFSEIFNNAIDHSKAEKIFVKITRTIVTAEIWIMDDGEGIFSKITRELGLIDERHAVLELSKGKLTTDPENHSGEGIFFSSRIMERFAIFSGSTIFSHEQEDDLDFIHEEQFPNEGTTVFMKMKNRASRTLKEIFDQFADPESEDYGFTKTVVPVRLAQYGDELLVSRSQAKRLLARVDRFKMVIFDFNEVNEIGQAFADEIFRVFAQKNDTIKIIPINMNEDVQNMYIHVL